MSIVYRLWIRCSASFVRPFRSSSLRANSTGTGNAAIGAYALDRNASGYSNTALGGSALQHNTTGEWNTAIGYKAGIKQTTGDNNIYISHAGMPEENGTVRVGTPGKQTRAFLAGIADVPVTGSTVVVAANGKLGIHASSRRYKEGIEDMGVASEALLRLRPVTFRYKQEFAPTGPTREYDLIAEEVADVYPELVGRNPDGEVITIRYDKLIPMLLNEIQRQHRQIEQLMARVVELERSKD